MKELYLELMTFFESAGGSYEHIDDSTYKDILKAVIDGRVLVTRKDGKIASVTTYWLVHEADLNKIINGGYPNDVNSGDIVYIADHAGKGAYRGLIKTLSTRHTRACWHHRYKAPETFRMYSRGAKL